MVGGDSLSRRRFLEHALTATVFATVVPGVILGKAVPALRKSGGGLLGTYTLSLDDYPALQNVGGSVRIKINGLTGRIIVSRMAEDRFVAVNERCPHQGFSMGTLDSTTMRFTCTAHGSVFTVEGDFISGPANGQNLTKYVVTFDGDKIVEIDIPGVSATPDAAASISFLAPISLTGSATGGVIRYGIAARAHVILTVHSIEGNEVMRLVDDVQEGGEHQLTFDASRLPSGAYFCRIDTTTGFVETRRFVVTR